MDFFFRLSCIVLFSLRLLKPRIVAYRMNVFLLLIPPRRPNTRTFTDRQNDRETLMEESAIYA
jgi:hypothetical protein